MERSPLLFILFCFGSCDVDPASSETTIHMNYADNEGQISVISFVWSSAREEDQYIHVHCIVSVCSLQKSSSNCNVQPVNR